MRNWKEIRQFEEIIFEEYNGIAKITINRPQYRNAFTPKTTWELSQAFAMCREMQEISVVLLTGAMSEVPEGKTLADVKHAFCSGGDMHVKGRGGYVDEEGVPRLSVLDVQMQIRRLPKPVIAMVNGYAIGGGHVLHLVCDLTIASENAIFGQTGPKVGSFDAGFGSSYLARIVGQKKAREIWFLCRQYTAREAEEMGMVNKVVPIERLEDECVEWAEIMMERSPLALRMIKAGLNAELDGQAGIQELAGDCTMLYYFLDEAQEEIPQTPMTYRIEERLLHFKQPAGTSRGVYTTRKIWLVHLYDGDRHGVGECAPLPDLSCDFLPNYAEVLECHAGDRNHCDIPSACHSGSCPQRDILTTPGLRGYPSMLFGLETALLNLQNGNRLFDTAFSRGEVGIPINGLVWMGNHEEMLRRMEEKLEQGFHCIKLKIGAIDFDQELDLIRRIRDRFSYHEVELRVDANGAFPFDEALYKLELLSQYNIHSIEQPIRQGQWAYMAQLCRESPLPIALDEELIGVNDPEMKRHMLNIIKPRYIILKPSLHGGMSGCREWIDIARDMGVGSWITSALESNIGLNAIAQFASSVYGDNITMPQGLGTGQLFTDNFDMGLEIIGDRLYKTSL